MAYTNLLVHIVIRPKSSQHVFTEEHEKLLYAYIWGFCKEKNCYLHRINGMSDHIHLLIDLHPAISVADFVKSLKVSTNIWIKEHRHEFPNFEAWGKGYCALTYSRNELDTVKNYIANQKEHHKKISFADEYTALLKEFGIEPDQWILTD